MYWVIFEVIIIFALINMIILIRTEEHESPYHIQTYEYGAHVPGEQKSFLHYGTIPQLNTQYSLNVTPTEEGLEKRFTYMRVEYVNAVSNVIVNYDPKKHLLTFAVVFPFVDTTFAVIGYSMPLKARKSRFEDVLDRRWEIIY